MLALAKVRCDAMRVFVEAFCKVCRKDSMRYDPEESVPLTNGEHSKAACSHAGVHQENADSQRWKLLFVFVCRLPLNRSYQSDFLRPGTSCWLRFAKTNPNESQ